MTTRALRLRWLLCCWLAACGSEAVTSAAPDAGANEDLLADVQVDVALPEEVTALADTVATDVGPIAVPTACWETACAPQLAACTAAPRCLALAHCAELAAAGKADLAGCKTTAGAIAVATWTDLTTCGAAACPDLFSASCEEQCGKPAAVGAPCACDGQCEQYGDCCYDYAAQCKGDPVGPKNTTCKGSCGTFFGGESCNCDAECVGYNDCCSDYLALCTEPDPDTVVDQDAEVLEDSESDAGFPSSCAGFCGTYWDGGICNCDAECAGYQDCCDDYQQVCLAADTTGTAGNDAVDPGDDATTSSDSGAAD